MTPRQGRRLGRPAEPLRLQFDDSAALCDAFARAQQECWVEGCNADAEARTLEVWVAPGVTAHPGAAAALRGRMERIHGRRG